MGIEPAAGVLEAFTHQTEGAVMSPTTLILLNVLLDLAVVGGLAALLLRPFMLERREATVAPVAQRPQLRRAA